MARQIRQASRIFRNFGMVASRAFEAIDRKTFYV